MRFKKTIPYSRQSISNSDILAVNKVLKSDYLTQGNFVFNLEEKINKLVKSKYSILTNSGTSALHLSCLSLNLKKNDIVWTVPNTFAATVNAPLLCGAKIDFVDIELDTFNICIKSLKKVAFGSSKTTYSCPFCWSFTRYAKNKFFSKKI